MREPFEIQTFNGPVAAVFEMPAMMDLAAGSADIPNSAAADVFRLISGRLDRDDPAQEFLYDKQHTRGVYELIALCVVEPRIFIPRVQGDPTPDGCIDYRDLPWLGVLAIYNHFRFGYPLPVPAAANHQPDVGEEPPSDGDDLPPGAE